MDQAITCTARNDLMTGTGAPRPIGSPVYEAQARAAAAWATGRSWSILLTSANHGTVGPLGSTFPHAGEHHERMVVVEVPAAAGAPSDEVNLVLRAAPAAEASAGNVSTDERATFERHERGSNLRRVGVERDGSGGWYENPCVQSAWEGWQARAAVAAQAGQVAVADLHDAIMRIACDTTKSTFASKDELRAYAEGHRDARHAAAELAAGAAAGQVAVLEGWKLVPLEPTMEMQQAGHDTPGAHMYNASYRAMLAAAPSAPAVAQQAPAQAEPIPQPGDVCTNCHCADGEDCPSYAKASTAGKRQEGGQS